MHISIEQLLNDAEGAMFDSALQLRRDLKAEYDPDLDPDTEKLFRGAIGGSETFALNTLIATFDGAAVGIALVHLDRLGSNSPMLAINEAMGFVPQLTWGVWQVDVSALRPV